MFHFGVPLADCVSEDVAGYAHPLPSVALLLRDLLDAGGGTRHAGIFRTSASLSDCLALKRSIGATANLLELEPFSEAVRDDPRVAATLLKAWVRELPAGVLDSVRNRLQLHSDADLRATIGALPAPEKALLLWLLDLMAAVVRNEEHTLMSPKSCAIVMAPNLLRPSAGADLLLQLQEAKAAVGWIHAAIRWRTDGT